jgi:hypothetical protein
MVAVFLVLLLLGDAMLAVLLVHALGTKTQDRTDELEEWVDERLAKQGE